jgi:hypothetical protein
MLVKVKPPVPSAEMKRTTDIFRGQIVDVTASVYTVQLTGTSDKLDASSRPSAPHRFWKPCAPASPASAAATKCSASEPQILAMAPLGPDITGKFHESFLRQRRDLSSSRARKSPSSVTARKATPTRRT